MDDISVSRADLGNTSLIAEGGQGKIFKLTHFRLPDFPGGIVYKEYKNHANFVAAGLRAIVQVRSRMSAGDRQLLDKYAVWPARVVIENNGNVVGLLMPHIPDEYVHQGVSSTGMTKNGAPKPFRKEREVQYLFIDPSRAQRLGFPLVNLQQRLRICLELARGLSFLASQHIVFGDISAKNALFRLGSSPTDVGVVLVDCDAVRVAGNSAAVKQLNSPDWDPPENERTALTHATDVYKFALFMIRVLSPSANASVTRDPRKVATIFDQRGMTLLRASLGTTPASRPKIAEWSTYLESFIQQLPPVRIQPQFGASQPPHAPPNTNWVPRTSSPSTTATAAPAANQGWKRVNGKWVRV